MERRWGRRNRKAERKTSGQKTEASQRSEQEEDRKREEEWEAERKRRRRDGGGAAHLQIKFVIQASDGPTARD